MDAIFTELSAVYQLQQQNKEYITVLSLSLPYLNVVTRQS